MSKRSEGWAGRVRQRALGPTACLLSGVMLLACATATSPVPPARTAQAFADLTTSASSSPPVLAAPQPRVVISAPPLGAAPAGASDAPAAQAPASFVPSDSPLLGYYDRVPHGGTPPAESDELATGQSTYRSTSYSDAGIGVGVGLGLGLLGLGIGLGFGWPYPYRYGYYGGGYGYHRHYYGHW